MSYGPLPTIPHWTCPWYVPKAPEPASSHWSQPRYGMLLTAGPHPGVPAAAHGWSPLPLTFPWVQKGIPAPWDGAENQPHGTTEPPRPSAMSSRKYGQMWWLPSAWKVTQPWPVDGSIAACGQAEPLMVIELRMFCGVLLNEPWI